MYENFLKHFLDTTKENAKIGDPFNKETYQGPQVSASQYEKILSYIEEGKKAGAKLLTGGVKHGSKGYFIKPTVFADVSTPTLSIPDHNFFKLGTEG